MYTEHACGCVPGSEGPWKYTFCSGVKSPDAGTHCAGLPKGSPGASRFVSPEPVPSGGGGLLESTDVGSWPPMKGEMHSGGNTSAGGLGCGAHEIRFSAPGLMFPFVFPVPVWNGIIVLPLVSGLISFLPSDAHRFPADPVPGLAWQPNGAGPLLKAVSNPCPIMMSATDVTIGGRTRRSFSELSLVSVYVPAEPPSIVHVPGCSGGRRIDPWNRTLGL